MGEKTKILIADDHPIFRHGLASVIRRSRDLDVVAEAGDGKEALEMTAERAPEIAILDIDMPEMDGVEAARVIREKHPDTITVFLTMHKDRSVLRSMGSLGVRGYLLKDSAMNEIGTCIRAVLEGGTYISPELQNLDEEPVDEASLAASFTVISGLTKAEKKVLALITESKTNREIADELFVSVRTVETHRYNICAKLSLNGPHALFKFAVNNGQRIRDIVRK